MSGAPEGMRATASNHNPRAQEEPLTAGSMFRQDMRGVRNWISNKKSVVGNAVGGAIGTIKDPQKRREAINEAKRKAGIAAYKNIRGAVSAAPAALYKGARVAAKGAARVAVGAALGATAGVIGATTGDGEKALGAAGAAFGVGALSGGNLFEGTVGKVAKDVSVKESYGAAKYGSKQDYRNEKSDQEFLKSQEFNDYYEKYFKGKKTKKEVKAAYKSYREAGITDKGTIRKAMALEDKYLENGGDKELVRQNVQGIVQTKDLIDNRSFRDDKFKEKDLQMLERQLTNIQDAKLKRQRAEQLFKGYRDFYELG